MVHSVRVDAEAQRDSEVGVLSEEPVAVDAGGYPLRFERGLSFGRRAS